MDVTCEFGFEAAHHLPHHPGKCRRPHGHSWRCRVTVGGTVDPADGMAFDFLALRKAVQERILARADHRDLNAILPNPTAELTAMWIWEELKDLPLREVRLWETESCSVTYRGPRDP